MRTTPPYHLEPDDITEQMIRDNEPPSYAQIQAGLRSGQYTNVHETPLIDPQIFYPPAMLKDLALAAGHLSVPTFVLSSYVMDMMERQVQHILAIQKDPLAEGHSFRDFLQRFDKDEDAADAWKGAREEALENYDAAMAGDPDAMAEMLVKIRSGTMMSMMTRGFKDGMTPAMSRYFSLKRAVLGLDLHQTVTFPLADISGRLPGTTAPCEIATQTVVHSPDDTEVAYFIDLFHPVPVDKPAI